MAFILDDLRNGVKNVTIYVQNQPIHLKINPAAVTQIKLDEYRDAQEDDDYDTAAAIFGEIVVEWDILQFEGGEPIPFNGDMFRVVPSMVTALIWDEIAKLVTPKSRKKKES